MVRSLSSSATLSVATILASLRGESRVSRRFMPLSQFLGICHSDQVCTIMLRPDYSDVAFLQNFMPDKYATHSFPNFSLGKTASSSIAIFVPIHASVASNVNFIFKNNPTKNHGGATLDLTEPSFKEMSGAGVSSIEDSLQHPIKVHNIQKISLF